MEEEADHEISMPVPLNSTYGGGGHLLHHHHPHDEPPPLDDNNNHSSVVVPYKKPPPITKYKECLKNHAASMGGNATDGCGEFMPSGADGTIEALTCSACSCHRNFHRKQTEGGVDPRKYASFGYHHLHRAASAAHHHQYQYPMLMHNNNVGVGGGSSEEMEVGGGSTRGKKRFRTKFSQEQKEKMQRFAERVGWKIQKQEEGEVQRFCEEVGVKRRVLKVWMHNNKNTLANKNIININPVSISNISQSDHHHNIPIPIPLPLPSTFN